MAVKTQGTKLYLKDPEATGGPAVLAIECATSLQGMGGGRDQIDITCLEDQARSFEPGLIAPSTVTMNINFDPRNASHLRLHELYEAGTKFDLAVGFSDGVAPPTLGTDNEFDLPNSRTFIVTRDTYVSDFPVDFSQNGVVTSSLTLQLSGLKKLFPKA